MESKKKWYKLTQLQNRKALTDLENDLWLPGPGIVRDFGKVMNTFQYFKWITTKTYCVAHGTQFSDIRQPGWDGSLGENEYMFTYGWVSSLFTWNYHNIVHQFIPKQNKTFKVEKKNVLHSEWYIAAAAKSLQSCPTLCNPIGGSPPGSPVPGILQARTLEWVAISFSNAWKWKVKVKLLSRVWLLATPWTAAYQAPPPMGFSRQEYWNGVPLPSPIPSH